MRSPVVRYATTKKYIYYALWHDKLKKENGLTDENIAGVLGISVSKMQAVIRYRKAHEGFEVEADILRVHIAELKARLEEREKTVDILNAELAAARKALRIDGYDVKDEPDVVKDYQEWKDDEPPAGSVRTVTKKIPQRHSVITAYTKAITDHERAMLELRTRIMELEGIYKETLSVELGANKSLIDVLDSAWQRRQASGDDGR